MQLVHIVLPTDLGSDIGGVFARGDRHVGDCSEVSIRVM